jgi:hypothetical protein
MTTNNESTTNNTQQSSTSTSESTTNNTQQFNTMTTNNTQQSSTFPFSFNQTMNNSTSTSIFKPLTLEQKMAAWTAKDPEVRFIAINLYANERSEKTRITSEKGRLSICDVTGRPSTVTFFGQLSCIHILQSNGWAAPSAVNKDSELLEEEGAYGIIAELAAYGRKALYNAAAQEAAAGNTAEAAEYEQQARNLHHRAYVNDEITFNIQGADTAWVNSRVSALKLIDRTGVENRCMVLACHIGWPSEFTEWSPKIHVLQILSVSEPKKALRRGGINISLEMSATLLAEQAAHEAAIRGSESIDTLTSRIADAVIDHQKRGSNNRAAARRQRKQMEKGNAPANKPAPAPTNETAPANNEATPTTTSANNEATLAASVTTPANETTPNDVDAAPANNEAAPTTTSANNEATLAASADNEATIAAFDPLALLDEEPGAI